MGRIQVLLAARALEKGEIPGAETLVQVGGSLAGRFIFESFVIVFNGPELSLAGNRLHKIQQSDPLPTKKKLSNQIQQSKLPVKSKQSNLSNHTGIQVGCCLAESATKPSHPIFILRFIEMPSVLSSIGGNKV